ncbi:MAG TPA: hypothetical protein ENM98_04570 [Halothiobacillaceae bacterium]|nr:hypothetical protein [Halothiobacillaceae bacterium]
MTDRNHPKTPSDPAEILSAWWDHEPVSEDASELNWLLTEMDHSRLCKKLRGYQLLQAHLQNQAAKTPDLLSSISAQLEQIDAEREQQPKQSWQLKTEQFRNPRANHKRFLPPGLRAPAIAASVIIAMLAVGLVMLNEPQQKPLSSGIQQAQGPSANDQALQATLESVAQTPQVLTVVEHQVPDQVRSLPSANRNVVSELPSWARGGSFEPASDPYLTTHYQTTTPEYGTVPLQMQIHFSRD